MIHTYDIPTAIASFSATEIDGFLCLFVLFARTKQNDEYKVLYIIIGQYLGSTLIYLVSMLGLAFGYVIPHGYMGLLGFLPLSLGFYMLYSQCTSYYSQRLKTNVTPNSPNYQSISRDQDDNHISMIESSSPAVVRDDEDILNPDDDIFLVRFGKSIFHNILHPQALETALIVIGNSGDNIAIYVPLFATTSQFNLIIVFITFYCCISIMLAMSYCFTNFQFIEIFLKSFGDWCVPFLLIGIGIYILMKSVFLNLLLSVV